MPTPYPANNTTPDATTTTPILVVRRENRSASHTRGTAKSMGSTKGSPACHGTARQMNSPTTMVATDQPSQGRDGVAVVSGNPSTNPNTMGPNVTMLSTDASTHNPMSAGASAEPAACAL